MTAQPARKDAARNRDRLMRAAAELFTTVGLDVSLKAVADQAGVGVGTVYRHFPTKDDLITAYFTSLMEGAVESAKTAAAEPDGWKGLVQFLRDSMSAQANNCGLRGLLGAAEPTNPLTDEAREAIRPYVEQLVDRAHEQGTLRPDFNAADVLYVQVALAAVIQATRETSPDTYRTHLDLLLDGMRMPEHSPGR